MTIKNIVTASCLAISGMLAGTQASAEGFIGGSIG
jgi:hypothetical protein